MIGLPALDAAGHAPAEQPHAARPDSCPAFRAEHGGGGPGELLDRAPDGSPAAARCSDSPADPDGLASGALVIGALAPDRLAPTALAPDRLAPTALAPGALVVGVGLRAAAGPSDVTRLIHRALREAGLPSGSVARLATLTGKGDHPAVRHAAAALGLPVDEHPAEALAAVAVPNPSVAVGSAVGTLSVAEAAALASAPGGELVVPKQKSASATVAVARAARGRPGPRDPLARVPGPSLPVDAVVGDPS
ncbi:cobalamin biosynthesis protein [Kitasatospora sp. NPDC086009]|uniref:cobalamin biosynthesis protein n=1 Tax=unclassified Kitasatospora TaxID=2633591 RepID=UPI0037C61D29